MHSLGLKLLFIFLWIGNDLHAFAEIPESGLIAHACGATDDGYKYTNCKESLLKSLDLGFKFIEIDLGFTSDSELVLLHHWDHFNTKLTDNYELGDTAQSLKSFLNQKIYGKYTPLSIHEFLDIVKDKDVVIVTDKISDPEVIDRYFSDYKDRLLIEAFTIEDFNNLKKLGYTPMYSEYTSSTDIFCESLINMIEGNPPLDFITLQIKDENTDFYYIMSELRCLQNLKIASFSTNLPEFINEHLGKDMDYIYTDEIKP